MLGNIICYERCVLLIAEHVHVVAVIVILILIDAYLIRHTFKVDVIVACIGNDLLDPITGLIVKLILMGHTYEQHVLDTKFLADRYGLIKALFTEIIHLRRALALYLCYRFSSSSCAKALHHGNLSAVVSDKVFETLGLTLGSCPVGMVLEQVKIVVYLFLTWDILAYLACPVGILMHIIQPFSDASLLMGTLLRVEITVYLYDHKLWVLP